MRLLKEQQSFSLSVAIQNSIFIIPYSRKFVQEFLAVFWLSGFFLMCRSTINCMQKSKEGSRGELDFCIPLRGRAGGRSGKTGMKKELKIASRVGVSGAKNTA